MNNNFLDEMINEFRYSRQLWELNSELADILEALFKEILDYSNKNNVQLPSGTINLLRRAEILFNQIANLKTNPNLINSIKFQKIPSSDEFLQRQIR